MDIVKEILRLPNFGYVFWGHDDRYHTAILGGQSCLPPEKHDLKLSCEYINRINEKMVEIYDKGGLSDDEKTYLAELMNRMMNACDTRLPNNYTHKEQTDYLNALTEDERNQIEHQVQMYLDCRTFYRDYIKSK